VVPSLALILSVDRPVEEQGRAPAVCWRIYSKTDSLYINIRGWISWLGNGGWEICGGENQVARRVRTCVFALATGQVREPWPYDM
jgi:hypothetical protein